MYMLSGRFCEWQRANLVNLTRPLAPNTYSEDHTKSLTLDSYKAKSKLDDLKIDYLFCSFIKKQKLLFVLHQKKVCDLLMMIFEKPSVLEREKLKQSK